MKPKVMRYRTWMDRWRVALLSAIGGLFSSATYLMAVRADEYLADLRYQEELAQEALSPTVDFVCYFNVMNPLWWVYASVWNIVLFTIMGVLIHKYLQTRVFSIFLLWQFIASAVVLAWGASLLFGVILDGYLAKGAFPLERIIGGFVYTSNQTSGTKFVAVMLASSVIYGTVMQVASKLYRSDSVE